MNPGEGLRRLRERKPLVHQITNYVVMNETANATLALGALPVMAHAREEVEEMAALAGALVLNIGTLSPHWVDAMIAAGVAANEQGVPVVLDPVGAGATRYRTDTARRILDEVDVTVLRGNAGEVATLVGVDAEVRGVESIAAGSDPGELARTAATRLGVVASVTGAVDHVSDGDAVVAIANGHELLASITGTGCMASAVTGCFLAVAESPFDGAAEALVAFGVAGEDAARVAKGPGSFHVGLYDALAALDPATLSARARVT
jgi:hydroxyethylthiazole kinase